MAGADAPGECRLVNELNVYKEDALLEFVFHPPNPRLSREHRDIVRRAREAWVSAFFFLNSTLVHSLVLNFRRYVIKSCASARG